MYVNVVVWFKYNWKSAEWDELVEKFNSVCKSRLAFNAKHEPHEILESWQILKHPRAHTLV